MQALGTSPPRVGSGMVPVGWSGKMVEKKVFDEVVDMLGDIERGVPLSALAHRYSDAHKKFVAERFEGRKLPQMLLAIDLPSEAIPLDLEVIHFDRQALLDDERPGC